MVFHILLYTFFTYKSTSSFCFRPEINNLPANTAFFGQYEYYTTINNNPIYELKNIPDCSYATSGYIRRISTGHWIVSSTSDITSESYYIRCVDYTLNTPLLCTSWEVYMKGIYNIYFTNGECQSLICQSITLKWYNTPLIENNMPCAKYDMKYFKNNIYQSNGYYLVFNEKSSKWVCHKEIDNMQGCSIMYYGIEETTTPKYFNMEINEIKRMKYKYIDDIVYDVDMICNGNRFTTTMPTQTPTNNPIITNNPTTTIMPTIIPTKLPTINPTKQPIIKTTIINYNTHSPSIKVTTLNPTINPSIIPSKLTTLSPTMEPTTLKFITRVFTTEITYSAVVKKQTTVNITMIILFILIITVIILSLGTMLSWFQVCNMFRKRQSLSLKSPRKKFEQDLGDIICKSNIKPSPTNFSFNFSSTPDVYPTDQGLVNKNSNNDNTIGGDIDVTVGNRLSVGIINDCNNYKEDSGTNISSMFDQKLKIKDCVLTTKNSNDDHSSLIIGSNHTTQGNIMANAASDSESSIEEIYKIKNIQKNESAFSTMRTPIPNDPTTKTNNNNNNNNNTKYNFNNINNDMDVDNINLQEIKNNNNNIKNNKNIKIKNENDKEINPLLFKNQFKERFGEDSQTIYSSQHSPNFNQYSQSSVKRQLKEEGIIDENELLQKIDEYFNNIDYDKPENDKFRNDVLLEYDEQVNADV